MTIVPLQNGDFKCVGLFSPNKDVPAKGCFSITFNESADKPIMLNYTFAPGTYNQNYIKSKGTHPDYYFEFKDVIVNQDGRITAVGEIISEFRSENSGGGYDYKIIYYDIIAFSVSPTGEIDWAVNMSKAQLSNSLSYASSFFMFPKNELLYIIFNDNISNIENISLDKPGVFYRANQEEANVVLVTLNKSGEMEKKEIFKSKQKRSFLMPLGSTVLDNGEIMINSKQGTKERYGILKFL